MQCRYCSQYLDDGTTVCPYCGQPQTDPAAQTAAPEQPPRVSQYDPTAAIRPIPPVLRLPDELAEQAAAAQGVNLHYAQTLSDKDEPMAEVLSTKHYMLSMFLSLIPVLGFILLLSWSFSKNTNPNKKHWARATLVYSLIGLALAVFAVLVVLSGTHKI